MMCRECEKEPLLIKTLVFDNIKVYWICLNCEFLLLLMVNTVVLPVLIVSFV